MAALADSLGDAYIDVHADTDPFRRELHSDLDRIGAEADDLMEEIGQGWGRDLSKGAKGELRKQLPDVVREFERGAKSAKIRINGDWFRLDRGGSLRRLGGQFADTFRDEAEKAFARAAAPGGPFSKIGEGVADAIGAGFNVSGRSPLIALLAIGVGGLVGVILAAVQAANALVAVLFTIPTLLTSIGLQAGVVMLAFDGIAKAAKGAFAAKNATELNEAIKNLTPSAQRFVKSLLPIRDFFRAIQRMVQESFFGAFGDSLTRVLDSLRPVLAGGLPALAKELGELFRSIALFFASPAFREFLNNVIPSTLRWLNQFSTSLIPFLDGLIRAANAAIPFLQGLGTLFNQEFKVFGQWLKAMVASGDFQAWLDSMLGTMQALFNLFNKLVAFVKTFAEQLDKAGGQQLIDELTEGLDRLIFLLESPAGEKFFQGMIFFGKLFIDAVFGMIYAIVLLTTLFEVMRESVVAFFTWLSETAIPAVGEFTSAIWDGFLELGGNIGNWVIDRMDDFGQFTASVRERFNRLVNDVVMFFATAPGKIKKFFTDLIEDLRHIGASAGHALATAIGDGIRSARDWVVNQVHELTKMITDFLPGSPAEKGPLSGQGYSFIRGQSLVKDMAAGMATEVETLRSTSEMVANSVFNTNLNFMGQPPSESQARRAGQAVTSEINSQVALRDMRLSVRMI